MVPVPLALNIRDHGDPRLVCHDPKFIDYFTFFATNYVAHAFTLVLEPGQTTGETLLDALNALFIPGSGALRAVRILRLNRTFDRSNSLKQAASAGALCAVYRKSDVLDSSNDIGSKRWWTLRSYPEEIPAGRDILGKCRLPHGYCLIRVSPQVQLGPYRPTAAFDSSTDTSKSTDSSTFSSQGGSKGGKWIKVPSNREIFKILVSLGQVIWGVSTLYETRGNQLDLYGYGAFGLTVLPYFIMSFVNLITNLLRPQYSCLYLVHTTSMNEAQRLSGSKFRGMIASAYEPRDSQHYKFESDIPETVFWFSLYVAISIIPLAIIGALTNFREGSDISIERAWILAWILIGSTSSILIRVDKWISTSQRTAAQLSLRVITVVPLWIPAIGGMVQVGRMLKDYGICINVD